MPRWLTSSAPRHGGTAAAVWNGKPNPIARRSVKTSSGCVPGAMPRSGSPCAQAQELEPDIDPATIGDAPVAFFPGEGWLDPVVYAHAMLSAARRRHGAKVICGARVVDLIMAGDRVTGVRVADGTQYEADTVVNCAGRWTNEATRDAGLHLPLAPTVGFLVFTPPVAAGLSRVVHCPGNQTRAPTARGRLMLHWSPTDATLSFDARLSPSMPEARDLVRRARQLLPSIGEVEPEAVRIAIRPIPGDHLSAIGPLPRTSGYYIAITHSGVTMSPFLARRRPTRSSTDGKGPSSPIFDLRVSLTDLETYTAGPPRGARRRKIRDFASGLPKRSGVMAHSECAAASCATRTASGILRRASRPLHWGGPSFLEDY